MSLFCELDHYMISLYLFGISVQAGIPACAETAEHLDRDAGSMIVRKQEPVLFIC